MASSPLSASLHVSDSAVGFSSTEAAFAVRSLLHGELDAKCSGQGQAFLPMFCCAASAAPVASLVFVLLPFLCFALL